MNYRTIFKSDRLMLEPDVTVDFDPSYNRAPLEEADDVINAVWDQLLSNNPTNLFNGLKFRLAGVRPTLPAGGDGMTLQLGITDYKEMMGTNNSPAFTCAAVAAAAAASEDATSHFSQALGVEALVVTSDGKAVFFKRSSHCAEMPGWFCCPGGHAEPGHLCRRVDTSDDALGQELAAAVPLSLAARPSPQNADDTGAHERIATFIKDALNSGKLRGDHIVRELFSSICDEVHGEIGCPREQVTCCGLVGIVAHAETQKPDAIFLVRCGIDAAAIQQHFHDGDASEGYEADGKLMFVDVADLSQGLKHIRLTPPSAACVDICSSFAQLLE